MTPSSPWEQVAIDLFHLDGQDFLLVVDYRSRYPEVISLRSTSADAVILATKSIFARHGIPDTVISDNGPQFASTAFENFAEVYGFRHITSSPRYPQSNGEVERMVRTIKDMFKKANDPYLALLAYRNTPGICGYSPAELLMGRSLRTRIPVPRTKLRPDWPSTKDFEDRDRRQRHAQARNFDTRHAAKHLRALKGGEEVWVQDAKVWATVLSPAQRPRSYVVQTSNGVLVRNRRHLVPSVSSPSALCTPSASARNSFKTPSPKQATDCANAQERTSEAPGLVSDAPVGGDHSQDGLTGQSATDNELNESIPVPGSPGARYSRFGRRLKTPCRLRF